jgi:hypothetical protein
VTGLQGQVQEKEQQLTHLHEEQYHTATEEAGKEEKEKEVRHVALMSDLRMAYDQEISQLKGQFQQKLSDQREEMQSSYLALLQKQMANLMGLVNSQDNDNDNDSKAVTKLEGMWCHIDILN